MASGERGWQHVNGQRCSIQAVSRSGRSVLRSLLIAARNSRILGRPTSNRSTHSRPHMLHTVPVARRTHQTGRQPTADRRFGAVELRGCWLAWSLECFEAASGKPSYTLCWSELDWVWLQKSSPGLAVVFVVIQGEQTCQRSRSLTRCCAWYRLNQCTANDSAGSPILVQQSPRFSPHFRPGLTGSHRPPIWVQ